MGATLLYAPAEYWVTPEDQLAYICNGCGPGGWKIDLVPDRIWGLKIKAVCDIHDFMYYIGLSAEDKAAADRAFLNNLLRLIDKAGGSWPVRWLRRRAAVKYYEAVHLFGGPAYWQGKNPRNELQAVAH